MLSGCRKFPGHRGLSIANVKSACLAINRRTHRTDRTYVAFHQNVVTNQYLTDKFARRRIC